VAGAAFGVATLAGPVFAAADGKKTFTILHTNDMHSAFIGLGPASDYTPFKPDDDKTRGGYARLADRGRRDSVLVVFAVIDFIVVRFASGSLACRARYAHRNA
jgi:hypothetical protein